MGSNGEIADNGVEQRFVGADELPGTRMAGSLQASLGEIGLCQFQRPGIGAAFGMAASAVSETGRRVPAEAKASPEEEEAIGALKRELGK